MYPEHEKLEKVKKESHTIGDFLDTFFPKKGWVIAKYHDNILVPVHVTYEEALAEFFDIDLKILEEEKKEILKSI